MVANSIEGTKRLLSRRSEKRFRTLVDHLGSNPKGDREQERQVGSEQSRHRPEIGSFLAQRFLLFGSRDRRGSQGVEDEPEAPHRKADVPEERVGEDVVPVVGRQLFGDKVRHGRGNVGGDVEEAKKPEGSMARGGGIGSGGGSWEGGEGKKQDKGEKGRRSRPRRLNADHDVRLTEEISELDI